MGIANFGIEKLLKPYVKGGTKEQPIKRTIETISGKLIIANKIPPDIVGAVVFKTFYDIAYNGLEFKGDGSYGSPGNDLFQYIRNGCVAVGQKDSAEKVVQKIMDITACSVAHCPMRTKELFKLTRWRRFKLWLYKPRGLWRL